jgi:hypothetical protein
LAASGSLVAVWKKKSTWKRRKFERRGIHAINRAMITQGCERQWGGGEGGELLQPAGGRSALAARAAISTGNFEGQAVQGLRRKRGASGERALSLPRDSFQLWCSPRVKPRAEADSEDSSWRSSPTRAGRRRRLLVALLPYD